MTRFSWLCLCVGVLGLCLGSSNAHGQQVRRYRAATPTVSPYLNLLRNNDEGALPNYYSLVRPQLQQQAFIQQQQAINQQQMAFSAQQAAAVGSLTSQIQPLVTPTGKASQFMNTSRYYPAVGGNRRR